MAYYLSLSELEEATNNFSKKIGKGSFGSVFYGKMIDGKEVAVKIMAESSTHGNQQFMTEVGRRPIIGWISLCLHNFILLKMNQTFTHRLVHLRCLWFLCCQERTIYS